MNIIERQRYLNSMTDFSRFNENRVKSEFVWQKLIRPPITSYIPIDCIKYIESLVGSVRLMNKPQEKYRLIESALNQYKFKKLNSGTNRRAFYCEYDPYVVLKIGSDNVGKSDNIYEYYNAEKAKPFCAKPFDVLPSGIMLLTERAEPMTEEDFKTTYAGEVFDVIFRMLSMGYIMEDIGANFFKNWGIRYGFGPILIDYPYIYEIDWSKIKCSYIDPRTHIKCNGEIDYDYDSGMSELVCTTCGTRYSARSLAKLITSNSFDSIIKKGRKRTMGLLKAGNFKIKVMRGNEVVRRYYDESDVRLDTNIRDNRTNQRNSRPNDYRVEYSNAMKDDIMNFLKDFEYKYGKKTTIAVANRLGIRYEFDKYSDGSKDVKYENIVPADESQLPQHYRERAQRFRETGKNFFNELRSGTNTVENNNGKPVTGLYIKEEESREEREAKDAKERGLDKEIMGFPSISVLDTWKFKQELPKLRHAVISKFNNFTEDKDKETTVEKLQAVLYRYIAPKVYALLKNDNEGLEVKVTATLDNSNKDCYRVNVTHRGSYILECRLYPNRDRKPVLDKDTEREYNAYTQPTIKYRKDTKEIIPVDDSKPSITPAKHEEEKEEDKSVLLTNDITQFLSSLTSKFDYGKYDDNNKMLAELTSHLYSKLMDEKDIHPAAAMKIAKKYVEDRFSSTSDEI